MLLFSSRKRMCTRQGASLPEKVAGFFEKVQVDRLHELTTPTLMIAGAVDSLLTPNLLDFMRLPNATLEVLSRAGHEVAIHEPQRVADAIRSFMQFGPVTAATLMARLA